jgi:hypothetical protein
MFDQYLQDANFAALAVWMIPNLFGNAWMKELQNHGVTVEKPANKEMMGMMIGSFIYCLVSAFGISYITFVTGTVNFSAALKMGALLGACVAWTSIGITYTWEKRSMKNLAIDGGYHVVGVIICTLILSLWR